MGIFVFMYFALLMIYLTSSFFPIEKRKFIVFFSFLLLWLIQACRADFIGIDVYNAYLPLFSDLGEISTVSDVFSFSSGIGMERGYQYYMRLVRLLSQNEHLFLAVTSFLFLLPISYIFYRYSKNITLSFVTFTSLIIYHFSFSGLRQALAISITFFSTKYIIKRKFLPFAICVYVASCFHKSAIIFFITYFLYQIRITKKVLIWISLVLIFIYIFIQQLSVFTVSVIFGGQSYIGYIEGDVGAVGLTLLYLLLTFFCLLSDIKKQPTGNFYCWMALLVLFSQSLSLVSQAAGRLGYYFVIYFSLSIPNSIIELKIGKSLHKTLNILFFLFFVFFFWYCNNGGYLNVVPYKFFWEK